MNFLVPAAGAAIAYLLLSKRNAAPSAPVSYPTQAPGTVPVSSDTPVAQRMATVLATRDPNAIRFEAARLRQEGFTAQADSLEKEAAQLEATAAAAQRASTPASNAPATIPVVVPPVAVQTSPAVQPVPAPIPAQVPVLVTPPVPPPVQTPPVVVVPMPTTAPPVVVTVPVQQMPLPVLSSGQYLQYIKPPAPFDPRVQLWQSYLIAHGISVGKDGADGKFGADTKTATINFQKKAGITADGVVGPQTLASAVKLFPAA
jgi:murein L,D-transpeptidase YcbB/YkuD